MTCEFKDVGKLKKLRENFLNRPLKNTCGIASCEKAFLNYMDQTEISYGDLENYISAFSCEKNTIHDLLATKNCLQTYIDRRSEYDTIISGIAVSVSILSALISAGSTLATMIEKIPKEFKEKIIHIPIHAIFIIVFLVLLIQLAQIVHISWQKIKDNYRINKANVLITAIDIVIMEKNEKKNLTAIAEKKNDSSSLKSSKNLCGNSELMGVINSILRLIKAK